MKQKEDHTITKTNEILIKQEKMVENLFGRGHSFVHHHQQHHHHHLLFSSSLKYHPNNQLIEE